MQPFLWNDMDTYFDPLAYDEEASRVPALYSISYTVSIIRNLFGRNKLVFRNSDDDRSFWSIFKLAKPLIWYILLDVLHFFTALYTIAELKSIKIFVPWWIFDFDQNAWMTSVWMTPRRLFECENKGSSGKNLTWKCHSISGFVWVIKNNCYFTAHLNWINCYWLEFL